MLFNSGGSDGCTPALDCWSLSAKYYHCGDKAARTSHFGKVVLSSHILQATCILAQVTLTPADGWRANRVVAAVGESLGRFGQDRPQRRVLIVFFLECLKESITFFYSKSPFCPPENIPLAIQHQYPDCLLIWNTQGIAEHFLIRVKGDRLGAGGVVWNSCSHPFIDKSLREKIHLLDDRDFVESHRRKGFFKLTNCRYP